MRRLTLVAGFIVLFLVACNENIEKTDETIMSDSEGNDIIINNTLKETELDIVSRTEIGIYIGRIDPHTIEIETSDGPTAFQLSDEAREDVKSLSENDEVIYSYYVDGEQLVIETIENYWEYRRKHHKRDDENDLHDSERETPMWEDGLDDKHPSHGE